MFLGVAFANIFVIVCLLYNFELNVTSNIIRNMIISEQEMSSITTKNDYTSPMRMMMMGSNPTTTPLESMLDGIGTGAWDPHHNHNNITKIVWMKWNTKKLPLLVQDHLDEMKKQNPTYEFRLVDDIDAEKLIKDDFPTIVYETYMSIHPNLKAARTDFWRYCVLYLYGGVFLDLDAKIVKPLEEWIKDDDKAILSFENEFYNFCKPGTKCHCHGIWDTLGLDAYPTLLSKNPTNGAADILGSGKPHLITQWAMVFPRPYNPVLKEVIMYMMVLLHRYRDQEQQNNPLLRQNFEMQSKIICTTGPAMWSAAVTRAFEKYGNNSSYLKTKFTENPKYEGLIYHADPLIKKILNGQHKHYLKIGRSHPLMVPPDGNNSSSMSSSNRSKLDETGYFEQASLPGLKI